MAKRLTTHRQPKDLIGCFVDSIAAGATLWQACKDAGFQGTLTDAIRFLESEPVQRRLAVISSKSAEARPRRNDEQRYPLHCVLEEGSLDPALRAKGVELRAATGAATTTGPLPRIEDMTKDQVNEVLGRHP